LPKAFETLQERKEVEFTPVVKYNKKNEPYKVKAYTWIGKSG